MIRQQNVPVKFWPDLASCHYSRYVTRCRWYETNQDFFLKSQNPPNCPGFLSIEENWGIVKGKLKKIGSVVQNDKEMLMKFKKSTNHVSDDLVRTMMGSIKRKVCESFGIIELKKNFFIKINK